jgi:membrane protein YdbS with pleckstrin-like domain
MKRVDVVALIMGVLLTAIAAGSLWLSFTGSVDWQLLKVVAPVTLIVVGVLGLTLSRNRT